MDGDKRQVVLNEPYKLFDYQKKTIDWIRERERACEKNHQYGIRGCMVSLTMGLGKTLVSLYHILSAEKGEYPTLVVSSKTIMSEWKSQGIDKFFSGTKLKVLFYHRDYIDENILMNITSQNIKKCDIVFTTYDVCIGAYKQFDLTNQHIFKHDDDGTIQINERTERSITRPDVAGYSFIYQTPWNRIICDESQKFANPNTICYRAMMGLIGKYKMCLTGTPIRNYDADIWSQLRFIGYLGITTKQKWKHSYFLEHNLITFIKQMNYDEAKVTLPEKIEKFFSIKFATSEEQNAYDYILKKAQDAYSEMMFGRLNFMSVLAWFIRLRQAAISPYIITQNMHEEQDTTIHIKGDMLEYCSDKNGTAGINSTKVRKTMEIVNSVPNDEKILIFSSYTTVLDLIASALEHFCPNIKYCQIDGSVDVPERRIILDAFSTNPRIRVMLLTYKVGGEGLNITAANHCIYMEPWWCPAVHSQALARTWRTGQTKNVTAYYIYMENSIEQRILAICSQKDELVRLYFNSSSTSASTKGNYGLNKHQMGQLLGLF
jgi:SNF2 family DNA or RNA helicase